MALDATAQEALGRLRRDIARMEGRLADEDRLLLNTVDSAGRALEEESGPLSLKPRPRRGRLPLGAGRLDAALGGGLPLATLHEVRADQSRDGGSAAGFVLALAARFAAAGGEPSLVWISDADLRREAGRLYAPGLAVLGLDPGRVIEVSAHTAADALWAFEAALGCRGVGLAVCELRATSLDLTATRRATLRARENGVTGFLVRLASRAEPTAADIRFALAPAPAGTVGGFDAGVGRPAWRLTLEKNRGGPTGTFSVEWKRHERSFLESGDGQADRPADRPAERPAGERVAGGEFPPAEREAGDAPAHPQPLPAAASDRPADPPPAAREAGGGAAS